MIYNRNKSLDFIKEEDDLKKTRVSKTAQVNLMMLADLGIEEAVHFQEVFGFSRGVLDVFSHVPMASQLPQCISLISEVLYRRTNEIIMELDNPVVLDLACGYSPRAMKVCDDQHTYIGVDLSDVITNLKEHRTELSAKRTLNDYYSVDLTKREELIQLTDSLKAPTTVITQGLLTYLTLEQKQILMENIKSLLQKDGGCWIIPDASPDRFLPDVFSAVLGDGALSVYKQMMKIVDSIVKRNRDANGWQTTDEICEALEKKGFLVERVPLYTDTLEMKSLDRIGPQKAQKVISNWQNTDSLIVTIK